MQLQILSGDCMVIYLRVDERVGFEDCITALVSANKTSESIASRQEVMTARQTEKLLERLRRAKEGAFGHKHQ